LRETLESNAPVQSREGALVACGALAAAAAAVALALIRVLALDRGEADDREG
jgi:hypothetical protein